LAEFVVLVYNTDDDLLEFETIGGTSVTNYYLLLIMQSIALNSA